MNNAWQCQQDSLEGRTEVGQRTRALDFHWWRVFLEQGFSTERAGRRKGCDSRLARLESHPLLLLTRARTRTQFDDSLDESKLQYLESSNRLGIVSCELGGRSSLFSGLYFMNK
jgi:hypothetical protein